MEKLDKCSIIKAVDLDKPNIEATALNIKASDWEGKSGINVTGTSDLAPLDQQADMVNELFPEAKTVAILYCSAETNSKYQAETITKYLEEYGYKVKD